MSRIAALLFVVLTWFSGHALASFPANPPTQWTSSNTGGTWTTPLACLDASRDKWKQTWASYATCATWTLQTGGSLTTHPTQTYVIGGCASGGVTCTGNVTGTCPANSTLIAGSCHCASGFVEQGSTCVPEPPACPTDTVDMDVFLCNMPSTLPAADLGSEHCDTFNGFPSGDICDGSCVRTLAAVPTGAFRRDDGSGASWLPGYLTYPATGTGVACTTQPGPPVPWSPPITDPDGDPTCGGEGQPACNPDPDGDPTCGGEGQPACTPDPDGDPTCGGEGQPACTPDPDGDPTCGGEGQPACGTCGGEGQPACGTCGGEGQPACGTCGGEGQPACNPDPDGDPTCGGEGQPACNPGDPTTDGKCPEGSTLASCSTLTGVPGEDGIKRVTKNIGFTPDNVLGTNGACPADRTVSVMGRTFTITNMSWLCGLLTSYVRPMAIILATIFAIGIVAGATKD